MTASGDTVVEGYRLSAQQAALWLEGHRAATVGCTIRLTGDLDVDTLRAAVEHVVREHEILRTAFRRLPAMTLPLQVVDETLLETGPVRWLGDGPGGRLDRGAEAETGPTVRARLTGGPGSPWTLELRLPALNADARTLLHLASAVCAAYRDLRAGRRPQEAEVQYAMFAEWQHEVAAGGDAQEGRRYWEEYAARHAPLPWPLATTPEPARPPLASTPEPARPPLATAPAPDAPAPSPPAAASGAPPAAVSLPPETVALLGRYVKDTGTEPFAVLLAAWTALVSRMSGGRETVTYAVFDGRAFEELRDAPGPYSHRLPVASGAGHDRTFDDVAGEVSEVLSGHGTWLAHAPAEAADRAMVAEYLDCPERFDLGAAEAVVTRLDTRLPGERLRLTWRDAEGSLVVEAAYDPAAACRADAEHLLETYATFLHAALAAPGRPIGELAWLGERQRRELLGAAGPPRTARAFTPFTRLFEEQARRSPGAVAVRCGGDALTYAGLNGAANALAARLRERGLGRGSAVAICLEPSIPWLVSALGVLKAGAAFVPVDPGDPAERQAFIVRNAASAAVIGGPHLAGLLPGDVVHLPVVEPADGAWPDPDGTVTAADAAYVIHTSGSTGVPKGVVVEHGGLASYLDWANEALVGDVAVPALSRPTFDASLKQLLAPLARGGTVWLLPPETAADPAAIHAALCEHPGPLAVNCVPSLWQALLEAAGPDRGDGLKGRLVRVLLGGEALPEPLAERTRELLPDVEIWNLYGPTEATANATAGSVVPGDRVTIGRPIAGTRVYLLGRDLEPVPFGAPGRLYIGGDGVARGYAGRPAETAARFVPDPFSGEPGARLYDTGDIARLLADGRLEFLGRDDLQVKLRGFRIELEGVEAGLRRVPGVRDAAVTLTEGDGGDRRLAGYLVPEPGARLTVSGVREHARRLLPDYMVPAVLTVVGALPLTPTGKVDRAALHAPQGQEPAAVQGPAAPRSLVEDQLIGIWSMVLGRPEVHPGDDFFALGGHSLLIVRLMARVHDVFGVELSPRTMFSAPTLREFARVVEQAMARRRGASAPAITPVPRTPAPPLSFEQQRMWILERLQPGSPRYNVIAARRIAGTVDEDAVRASLAAIAARHEVLRTGFADSGGQPRLVIREQVEVPFAVVESEEAIRRLADEPFDLAAPPLLRAALLRAGPQEAVLVLVVHHIVCDGWAKSVLFAEFAELYRAALTGDAPDLPELPVQYADFAAWQRDRLGDEVLAGQLAYWRDRLADAPVLRLPTDRPRTPHRRHEGAAVRGKLPAETSGALRRLAVEHGATLFMTAFAAFTVLLSRYSGQRDIVVGTPVANRNRVELERLVGFFVNTVPLRTDLSGDPTFAELLGRVREAALGAYANQDVPFERIVEELRPARDPSITPIFQAMYVHVPPGDGEVPLGGGTTLLPHAVETRTALFDVTLSVLEEPDGLDLYLNYDTELFDEVTARRMLDHLELLLEAIADDPERRLSALPALTPGDRDLLESWRAPRPEASGECLHRLIEAQAERTPDAVAVAFAGGSWTYRELNERANRLAHRLIALGVGPEELVAVCAERSPELIAGLLAVLKAGGGYVPVDPDDPAERVAALLAEVSPVLTLADRRGREKAAAWAGLTLSLDSGTPHGPAANPDVAVSPDNVVYAIFTSGSTGRPKAAVNTHRAVCNELHRMRDAHRIDASDAVLLKTRFTFDVSVWELFWPLTAGAGIVVTEPRGHLDPFHLARVIEEYGVTIAQFVPTMLRAYLDAGAGGLDRLRTVLCIGEALPQDLQDRFLARYPGVRLVNLYGPAEAAIHVTDWECRPGVPVSLGAPIPGTAVHVLDSDLRPVPVGVPGELYLGGTCLARGYLGRPALTAERFVPDPFSGVPGARLYATGDLARYRNDGTLEFLGRADHQLKIRGHRVEPGEVEAALMRLPEVGEALVVPYDGGGDVILAAYVTPAGGAAPSVPSILRRLRRTLPGHLVPGAVTVLPGLPRTPNGKLDRKALPDPVPAGERTSGEAPRDEVETRLAEIWRDLLNVGSVGLGDDFLALGGHSLLMIRLASRVRDAFGVEPSPLDVLESRTLAGYAERIRRLTGAPPPQEPGDAADGELSHAQRRLWFVSRMQPDDPVFTMAEAWRIDGDFDPGVAERAVAAVVARHDVLRSAFTSSGGVPRVRIEPSVTVPLQVADLRERPGDAEEWLRDFAATPFDIERAPLLRVAAARTGETSWILAVALHHIVGDAWSLDVLIGDLVQAYRRIAEGGAEPPPLPAQYADFVAWQRDRLQGGELDRQLGFWRRALDGAPGLRLPTDRPRPETARHRGDRVRLTLPPPVLEALRELSVRLGATMHMSTLAAFFALLGRYSGQDDFTVGGVVTNRARSEFEPLIGCFVNAVTFRADLSGDPTYRELIGRVLATAREVYANQDIPFEKLVEELRPARDRSRAPLFQVLFMYAAGTGTPLDLPGATVRPLELYNGTALYDLRLLAGEDEQGLHLLLTYDRDLFDRETAERMLAGFAALLECAVRQPDVPLSRLPWPPCDQLPAAWTPSEEPDIGEPVHQVIRARAAATPGAPAVTHGGRTLSHRELDGLAGRLAARLRAHGCGPGSVVGILIERSPELVAGILAILRTGAAYLPLDPGHPPERIRFVIADAAPAAVLTTRGLAATVRDLTPAIIEADTAGPGPAPEDAAEPVPAPGEAAVPLDAPAYVIYTSGSTGQPKGVVVSHRALAASTAARLRYYRDPVGAFLLVSPAAFDSSVAGLFWTLATGGRLVLPGEAAPGELAAIIERERVSHLLAVPSLYGALLGCAAPEQLASLRTVIVAGEAVPSRLLAAHHERVPGATLYNEYGVTEAGVWSSVWTSPPGAVPDPVPAGRPIAGTRLYVLDRHLAPVPAGGAGELYIAGAGLAQGYLGRPALTAERFVPDPFSETPGARMYRTGDLVRVLPGDGLVVLGRIDNQVKVHGHRIEPEEVEAALRTHPGVRAAVVAAAEDGLVAYVVPEPGPAGRGGAPAATRPGDAELREHLRARLPAPMVPGVYMTLDELPLTPNGKIDRAALPEPGSVARPAYEAPRDELEEEIAAVWAELFELPRVGVHDDFFALGGHSLLALQVIARIEDAFEASLPLHVLFEAPTVAELATRVEQALAQRLGEDRP
ncbi:amino acid adenylation domain-containing protein [Nonomuraea sp. NPDC049309]|uniref:non-ribosomal peptide synthetase n=1 Tax=Nonomuraea sp. NPDC049309 TaxID=3364350 RepID=UPI0037239AA4